MVVLQRPCAQSKPWSNLSKLMILAGIVVVLWVGLVQMTELLLQFPAQQLAYLDSHFNSTNHLLKVLRTFDKSHFEQHVGLEHVYNQRQMLERLTSLELELSQHLAESVNFLPLKDLKTFNFRGENGIHGFMSAIRGRPKGLSGAPELMYFPSNISQGRLLCLKGNNTSNGTRNFYAFAYKDALPEDAIFLSGTTLISETYFDYTNPWHSMFNLVQFVYWKVQNGCSRQDRLALFHLGELRVKMGYWISHLMKAVGLYSAVESLSYEGRPVCFENAVAARSGIAGTTREILQDIFREVRCQARRMCNVTMFTRAPSSNQSIHVSLVVRPGSRGFVNQSAWQEVIKQQCEIVSGCEWSVIDFSSNLTFCEQVRLFSHADVLISVHGAQLTNMIFMSPGARIMELFPRGWLELAGGGQHVLRQLADWVGMVYEGSWRDPDTPTCPNPHDARKCFSFYKDQPVGINATHLAAWLSGAIDSFDAVQQDLWRPSNQSANPRHNIRFDRDSCQC